jgi:hypothetical protein
VAGYWKLVALARREAELIAAGELEQLPALHAEWDSIVASLPASPPPHARAALAETQRLVAASTAALAASVERTSAELQRLGTGRRAAAAYQAAGAA